MTDAPLVLATLEGYAVEGGFDGSREPATCYSPTIALGRHPGPGAADGLWRDYERVIDLVPELGLDGVRLTVEWARVEPRPGVVDVSALERYAQVARHARALGLHVTVVLVDAVWPSWLGLEAWLLPWVLPRAIEHSTRVVAHLRECVTGVVAVANPSAMIEAGYLTGAAPPWRRGARSDAAAALGHLARMTDALRADPVVGPLLVTSSATIALTSSVSDMAERRRSASDCAEIHVRSLVRGAGPTRSRAALLVHHGDRWSVGEVSPLLAALR